MYELFIHALMHERLIVTNEKTMKAFHKYSVFDDMHACCTLLKQEEINRSKIEISKHLDGIM